jgi:hypothetical protein
MRLKPDNDKISWDELADNRDLTIFVTWDPTFSSPDEMKLITEYNKSIE